MERNAIQWLGAPCCLRGSFAFYKSFRCGPEPECRDPDRQDPEQQDPDRQDPEQQDPDRQDPEQQDPERQDPDRRDSGRPARVWRLGEFYFIRCSPQDPVCVAELALLWEDRAQRHLLASSRLYFLPEDTPTGRTEEHGEDEVLAVSKKIVLRVEDLVNWTCPEPSGWKRSGPNAHRTENCNGISPTTNSDPTTTSDPGEQRAESGPPACRRLQVKVLSYLQYCRFRSLQRRVQDPPALQDPHLLALGGVRISPHTLVLYCRDTFTHPTLDNSSSLWTQLGCTSLSLKGRPRKRRGVDGRERSPLSQSESWIEKMKENVMGSVEVPWEGGWLPHPEEQPFLDQLYSFMERRGSPISKVPNLGFKKIDLFLLFSVVKRLGGYERVTAERLWKQVYNELGGSPGSTSAATCTRRHYERLILAYEEHLTGGEAELSKPLLPSPANGSKELQKEKAAVANQRVKMSSPSGPGVRKRGRPPSRRNSKTAPKTPRTEAPPTQTTPTPTGLQDPSGAPGPEAARLGPFSPPKGLCPLELFRSRLGLSAAEAGPPSPALQPSPGVLLAEGGSRGPPPPLRVLPLDIGCSLQVRQLMRTRLGSAQLSSFAKRLTEVLAHDLSKARPPALATPPGPLLANQEQALPLNLSKRCGEKREGGGAGGGAEWREDDSSLALKRVCGGWDCSAGGGPLVKPAGGGSLLGGQDEPADLSCPRRARASLRQHNGQEAGPQCAPGPSPQPPLASGGDGGVAWDSSSDAGADCRGAE